jgi:hypothetical protein
MKAQSDWEKQDSPFQSYHVWAKQKSETFPLFNFWVLQAPALLLAGKTKNIKTYANIEIFG